MSESVNLRAEKPTLSEKATLASFVAIAGGATMHSADAYMGMNIPGVEDIPLIDHSTSMFGGYFVGLVVDGAMERMAVSAENHDKPRAAERIRKLGSAAAIASSLVSQIIMESNPNFGYGDKLDIVFGVAATIPGIAHSRSLTRRVKQLQERRRVIKML